MLVANVMLVGALVLGGAMPAQAPKPIYAVAWSQEGRSSDAQRWLVEQVDYQLKDELSRRGVVVGTVGATIVLSPQLEILPTGLKLSLVEVRNADRALLGTVCAKVSGKDAKALRALVTRAVDEANRL